MKNYEVKRVRNQYGVVDTRTNRLIKRYAGQGSKAKAVQYCAFCNGEAV